MAQRRQGPGPPRPTTRGGAAGGLVREGCTDLLAHLHEKACSPRRARVGPPSALTPACYHSDPNFPLLGDINQSRERLLSACAKALGMEG